MALVILIRGLNVGGRRRFRPTELARQLSHLGAKNIGATGVLIVREPLSRARLRSEIERRLPFEAEIFICSGRDIAQLTSLDVFERRPARPGVVRFVSLLSRRPQRIPDLPTQLPCEARWVVKVLALHGRFVVGIYRREMRAIRYLGELDELFGARATTRSWTTITAITEALAACR